MPKRGGAKTSTKVVKDPEMIKMFNQMMGQSDPEPDIIMPKYEKIMRLCKTLLGMLSKFTKSPCVRLFSGENRGFEEIRKFVKTSEEFLATNELKKIEYTPPTERRKKETMEDLCRRSARPTYDPSLICGAYSKLKDSRMIQEFMRSCAHLVRFKDEFANESYEFMFDEPGSEICLFSFSCLNFKAMFISDNIRKSGADKYLITFLRIFTNKLDELYKAVSSPDINVDKFSEVLTRNLGKVRSQIPGCDRAFDKIVGSIGLLKNNFGDYHKDFLESGNPGIIIENFVQDVAANSSADAKTTVQFGKIINFYRNKMRSVGAQRPEIAKIFSMVDENYRKLEEAQAEENSEENSNDNDDNSEKNKDDNSN